MTDPKCTGTSGPVICPMRDSCRRFTAPSGQSWFDEIPQPWFNEVPLYRLDTQSSWKCDEHVASNDKMS